MRDSGYLAGVVVFLSLNAADAAFDVVIDEGPTIGGSFSNGSFVATESAHLAASDLEAELAVGDVTVSGARISVVSSFTYTANTLTLSATGDIVVDAVIGGSSLAVEFGQGAPALDNPRRFRVHDEINLSGGYTAKTGADGVSKVFILATNWPPIPLDLSANYALTSSGGALVQMTPVGDDATPFTGDFDGLGHTSTDFTFAGPGPVGFFGVATGTLRNFVMRNYTLSTSTSHVGGLAGKSSGLVHDVRMQGCLFETDTAPGTIIGGVIGENNGTIEHSESTCLSLSQGDVLGNLVGQNNGTMTDNRIANAAQPGTMWFLIGNNTIGGLVGRNTGSISRVTVDIDFLLIVQGADQVGGIVGDNQGTIEEVSLAPRLEAVTLTVSGVNMVGGIAGKSSGTVRHTRYPVQLGTQVSNGVGGCVGLGDGGLIEDCDYTAPSEFGADHKTGGILGEGNGTEITGCHFSGTIVGLDDVGGIVGKLTGTISDVSVVATLKGQTRVGGIAGTLKGDLSHASADIIVTPPTKPPPFDAVESAAGIVCTFDDGSISDVHARGTLGAAPADVVSASFALSGFACSVGANGTVTQSESRVTMIMSASSAAGFVGTNNGHIDHCYAVGNARGNTSGTSGGFVGINAGNIDHCYATGAVLNGLQAGGFAGSVLAGGSIDTCYATGDVTHDGAGGGSGGFVGRLAGTITNSFASGAVSGNRAGGFAEECGGNGSISRASATGAVLGVVGGGFSAAVVNSCTLHQVFSEGAVVANSAFDEYTIAGGLIGAFDSGNVSEAFATGGVTGSKFVGGLVGRCLYAGTAPPSSLSRVFVHGHVSDVFDDTGGSGSVAGGVSAGFVGNASNCLDLPVDEGYAATTLGAQPHGLTDVRALSASWGSGLYWDTTLSGTAVSGAGTGHTTAEMYAAATFSGWDFSASGAWSIAEGTDYPRLRFATGCMGEGAPCHVGTGACFAQGEIVCDAEGGSTQHCSVEGRAPSTELCDGIDNDCNGDTDEGFTLGAACVVGMGACAVPGTTVCNGPNATGCNALALLPTGETCGDLIDSDCDGDLADDDVCAPAPPGPSGMSGTSGTTSETEPTPPDTPEGTPPDTPTTDDDPVTPDAPSDKRGCGGCSGSGDHSIALLLAVCFACKVRRRARLL